MDRTKLLGCFCVFMGGHGLAIGAAFALRDGEVARGCFDAALSILLAIYGASNLRGRA